MKGRREEERKGERRREKERKKERKREEERKRKREQEKDRERRREREKERYSDIHAVLMSISYSAIQGQASDIPNLTSTQERGAQIWWKRWRWRRMKCEYKQQDSA